MWKRTHTLIMAIALLFGGACISYREEVFGLCDYIATENKATSRQCNLSHAKSNPNWLPSGVCGLSSQQRAFPPLRTLSRLHVPMNVSNYSVETTSPLPGLTISRHSALTHIGIGGRLDIQQGHHAVSPERGWLLALLYSLTLPIVAALTYRGRIPLVLHCPQHFVATALHGTSAWAIEVKCAPKLHDYMRGHSRTINRLLGARERERERGI